MFIAALFIIPRTWKKPKCPSEKWIKKMRSIYTHGIPLSHEKKKNNEILPFAAIWMDLETIILSEISRTEKDK